MLLARMGSIRVLTTLLKVGSIALIVRMYTWLQAIYWELPTIPVTPSFHLTTRLGSTPPHFIG